MYKKKQKAFTLLELLVVIAIIGILISLGVASFSNAQKKSRDSRRREDLKALQNGLEQHYADNNSYSDPSSTYVSGSNTAVGNLFLGLINGNEYFPAGAPVDPRNQSPYIYKISYNTDAYCICAQLESSTGNATTTATGLTCNYAASGNFFCVSNLQ
jgi:prepilin-type N-terminal cleavage/methylation domain-containing protein